MLFNTKNNITIPCYKYRGKFHSRAIFHRHKDKNLQDSTIETDDRGRYSLISKHLEKNPIFGKLYSRWFRFHRLYHEAYFLIIRKEDRQGAIATVLHQTYPTGNEHECQSLIVRKHRASYNVCRRWTAAQRNTYDPGYISIRHSGALYGRFLSVERPRMDN